MALKQVYITTIAVMECVEDMVSASQLVLDKLAPDTSVRDYNVTRHRVTQWTDPDAQAMVVTDSGRFKYTINTTLTFIMDGEYADVQNWVVSRLMEDEEHTHMIIQALDITMADYVQPVKDLYREDANL